MHIAVYYRVEESPVPIDTRVDNTGQPHLIGLLQSDKQWKVSVREILVLHGETEEQRGKYVVSALLSAVADAVVIMNGRDMDVRKNRYPDIVTSGVLLKTFYLFLRYAAGNGL